MKILIHSWGRHRPSLSGFVGYRREKEEGWKEDCEEILA